MLNDMFLNGYPYTDFHELNLSWVIKRILELTNTVNNFVSLNVVKYADPIQWNITKQYEQNTVVVDPITGTAYLSTQPVPLGVALTNTDYWTPIFNLNLLSANQNITLRDDGSNVLATFDSHTNDWLLWNNLLYIVTQDIHTNEAYVEGYNISRYTVEQFLKDYIQEIITMIGSLDDLTTTDKTSVVNAINELVSACTTLSITIGNLDDLTTTDKDSIVDAINELVSSVGSIVTAIGDLNDLNTTDKTSIVNAINEVLSTAVLKTVKDYGAVGDGVTDDTTAILACVASENLIIFPSGDYVYNSSEDIHNKIFIGFNAKIICGSGIRFFDCEVYGLTLDNVNGVLGSGKCTFDNCTFECDRHALNVNNAIDIVDGSSILFNNCTFEGRSKATMGIWANDSAGTAKLIVQNCVFKYFYLNAIFSSAQECIIDNCYFQDNHQQVSPTGGGQIDIGAVAGVKTNCCVRNCQFWGGNTATCGIETAGASGLFITIQDCTINAQNGTWCIALQDGTFANIFGNFLYSNASYPNISLTGGSEAVSNANYIIGTKYSDATKVKNYGEFT